MRPFYCLLALLGSLLRGPLPAGATTHPKPPTRPWRGFSGPAYLPAPLPRRPRQAVLDSLARAAARQPRTFSRLK